MITNDPKKSDVLIIGGGPAGLSASIWCSELGLSSIVLEKDLVLGGQLHRIFNPIENYLGVIAANGRDLCDHFLKHTAAKNIQYITGANVSNADLVEKIVTIADGGCFAGRAILIATGIRRRMLNVSGEQEFQRRGILLSGVKARDEVKGKKVLIVGGGDAALENALVLSEKAARVYVVHRRREFSARREFIERLEKSPLIEVLTDHAVTAIKGSDRVEAVDLHDLKGKTIREIAVDYVLIRIGVVPNTEMFRGQVELDDFGFIQVDAFGFTSVEGTYAAGDVASPNILSISNAVGQGAAAAKFMYSKHVG